MSKYHRETGKGAAHSSYCDYFGSWKLALKAAGYGEARFARYLSDEVLCEQLRRLAKELGHTPLRKELDARRGEYPCSQTYYDRFGSWREALDRAGLVEEYHYRRDMSDEDLLEMLRRLAAELGRVPTVRDLEKYDWVASHSTFCHRFGRWSNALKAAGLSRKKKPKPLTGAAIMAKRRKKVIRQLKAFIRRESRLPTSEDLGKKTKTPCYRTCISYFGSWEAMISLLSEEAK